MINSERKIRRQEKMSFTFGTAKSENRINMKKSHKRQCSTVRTSLSCIPVVCTILCLPYLSGIHASDIRPKYLKKSDPPQDITQTISNLQDPENIQGEKVLPKLKAEQKGNMQHHYDVNEYSTDTERLKIRRRTIQRQLEKPDRWLAEEDIITSTMKYNTFSMPSPNSRPSPTYPNGRPSPTYPNGRPSPTYPNGRPSPSNSRTWEPTLSPTPVPTVAPTAVCPGSLEETAEVRATKMADLFAGVVVDPDSLEDPSSPQSRAAKWLVGSDGARLCFSNTLQDIIVQRYILAVFYYATGGGDSAWKEQKGFLEPTNECLWDGVECDEGESGFVQKLNIDNNNLSGALPSELYLLSNLTNLELDSNELTGSIPSDISKLTLLETYDMDKNNLIGTLPSVLYSMTSLKVLDLNDNELSGKISEEIGELSQLRFIQIHQNKMSGKVPKALGTLELLETLSLHYNDFSGEIPESVCQLPNIFRLTSDCSKPDPKMSCSCCTVCF